MRRINAPYYVSAYGIAKRNGFTGTEEEWLESLKGNSGPQGEAGPKGEVGPQGPQGVAGPQGVSIVSIKRTDGNGSSGTTDTYTITMSDGTVSTFDIYNGRDGDGAGDMLAADYDPTNSVKNAGGIAGYVSANARPATWMPTASDVKAYPLTPKRIGTTDDILKLPSGNYDFEGTIPSGMNYPASIVGEYSRIQIYVINREIYGESGYGTIMVFCRGQLFINAHLWNTWSGWIEYASKSYAVPLDGSKAVTGALLVDGGFGRFGASNVSAGFSHRPTIGDSTNMSWLGVSNNNDLKEAVQFLRRTAGKDTYYNILHTGNKPSGSYTGNGSAASRPIDIGGLGNVVAIWSGEYGYAIVFGVGAIAANANGAKYFSGNAIKYVNGRITIASADNFLNANGVTYYYQVL